MKNLLLFVLALSVSAYSIVAQAESLPASSFSGKKLWTYSVGDFIYGSPVIDESNNIYFASRNANIYSLNSNGSLRWQRTVLQGLTHSLTYQNDTIYYRTYGGTPDRNGSNPEEYGALNATTGQPLWSHTFGEWGRGGIAVAADGTSYIVDWDVLKKFSPDGEQLSSFSLSSQTATTPLIAADGSVYTYSLNGALRAFTPDLKLLWTKTLPSSLSPLEMAIGKDGTIYVPVNNGVVYAVSNKGQLLWQCTVGYKGQNVTHGVVIDRNDNIIMSVFTGTETQEYIQAISPQGELLWSSAPFGSWQIGTTPTIADNGTILVGASGSGIYTLSETGAYLWSTSFTNFSSSVAIGNNGVSYLANFYSVSAYSTSGLKLADTSWPRQHGNLAGTNRVKIYTNQQPELTIDYPLSGTDFLIADGAIDLQATALDFEDGDISHLVEWTSDLDGTLTSPTILSVGLHTITAKVTDNDDNSASAYAQVTVRENDDEVDEEEEVEDIVNQAPNLAITIKQHGKEVDELFAENGAIHITVIITDPNPEDSHSTKWFLNGIHLIEFDNLLNMVIPSVDVVAGEYEIRLEVSDNGEPVKTQIETRTVIVEGVVGTFNTIVIAFMMLLMLQRKKKIWLS